MLAALADWPGRRWLAAVAAAALAALVIGVPTGIIDTPIYHRMTAVTWWDYPFWAVSALLLGVMFATYMGPTGARPAAERRTLAGGLLSFMAVGCPVCNKLVVLLIGASGALDYFGPLQPLIGLAGVALLVVALALRLRRTQSCVVPVPR